MRFIDACALILLILSGLNMGIAGLFHFEVIAAIFGTGTVSVAVAYVLIILSAIYCIARFKNMFTGKGIS